MAKKTYSKKVTALKGAVSAAVAFVAQIGLEATVTYLQYGTPDVAWLDTSVRSVLIGGAAAGINWLKNRHK